jgi:hypothetical protein
MVNNAVDDTRFAPASSTNHGADCAKKEKPPAARVAFSLMLGD